MKQVDPKRIPGCFFLFFFFFVGQVDECLTLSDLKYFLYTRGIQTEKKCSEPEKEKSVTFIVVAAAAAASIY